jgi:hypothetical protein
MEYISIEEIRQRILRQMRAELAEDIAERDREQNPDPYIITRSRRTLADMDEQFQDDEFYSQNNITIANDQQDSDNEIPRVSSNSDNVNMILNTLTHQSNSLPRKDILIDSGAQSSVLQYRHEDVGYYRKGNQSITFGNGTTMTVDGIATIGPISNISVCKGISENIASVSQLADNGCVVLFDRNRVLIMKPNADISINNDEILLEGNRVDDLYRMNLDIFTKKISKLN